MKKIVVLSVLLAAFMPAISSAAGCSSSGYTVIYVNGILTSKEQADNDRKFLEKNFIAGSKLTDVKFLTGYNASHLAGAGDLAESVSQAYGASISDYDLNTILMQVAPDVSTRKILLAGHSQGTFYTNEIYKYLISHGVSKESLAVYNIATPADSVAGGGNYLTSATDKVIESAREWAAAGNANVPLLANIILSLSPSEKADPKGGHHMSSVYLAQAPDRIVAEIDSALKHITAHNSSSTGDCFTPPPQTVAYKMQAAVFAVADPTSVTVRNVGTPVVKGAMAAVRGAYAAVATAADFVTNPLAVLPPADATTVANAFPGVRALYGSSLAQADVEDLMGVNDAPAIEPPPAPPEPAAEPTQTQAQTQPQRQLNQETQPTQEQISAPQISIAPGFGGGAAPAPAKETAQAELAESNTQEHAEQQSSSDQNQDGDEAQPNPQPPPVLAVLSPSDNSLFATTSITVSGTTTPNNGVEAQFGGQAVTTSADNAGDWSLRLTLPEGTTAVSFGAFDSNNNATTTLTRSVIVDTTPPAAPHISVLECAYSLAADVGAPCLIATTTATVTWDTVTDATQYEVSKNGTPLATIVATSSTLSLTDGQTTTVTVTARDMAGNAATSTASSVVVFLQPVVINEIAWAGTNASVNDQWFELKNRTTYKIDLSRVSLSSTDGAFSALLSGTVGSTAGTRLYVAYRARNPISGSQTHAVSFDSFSPGGMELVLSENMGTLGSAILDTTPPISTCGTWCAGAYNTAIGTSLYMHDYENNSLSMERISDSSDGALSASWASNDMYTTNGTDARSQRINGTPGIENSLHQAEIGWYCSPGTHSITSGDTYSIPSTNCVYLSRFISYWEYRTVALFRGTVGSSTSIYQNLTRNVNATFKPNFPNNQFMQDPHPGEPLFVAIWDTPTNSNYANDFVSYFTTGMTLTGNSTPPHTNFRTLPFILGQ